ncbi:MAG: hypothetical protein EPN94_06010 [Nitrospirae bacterium]|nr:MAG: hypothetical protein EPN94_06010 [Nitrospirota bacterium]
MLLCFGAAWPVSIYKSYTSRTTAGKSVTFLFIVLIGYIAGIFHKVFNNFDFVIWLYIMNAAMVAVDILLYMRNKRLLVPGQSKILR